jgi:hypothetical protein
VQNKNVPSSKVPSQSPLRKKARTRAAGSWVQGVRSLRWVYLILSLWGTVDIVFRLESPRHEDQRQRPHVDSCHERTDPRRHRLEIPGEVERHWPSQGEPL